MSTTGVFDNFGLRQAIQEAVSGNSESALELLEEVIALLDHGDPIPPDLAVYFAECLRKIVESPTPDRRASSALHLDSPTHRPPGANEIRDLQIAAFVQLEARRLWRMRNHEPIAVVPAEEFLKPFKKGAIMSAAARFSLTERQVHRICNAQDLSPACTDAELFATCDDDDAPRPARKSALDNNSGT